MMSVDYSFSQHLSNKNLKHVTVQCIRLATNKKKMFIVLLSHKPDFVENVSIKENASLT